MSTVQNILDLLQYHPDIQVKGDDIIHCGNTGRKNSPSCRKGCSIFNKSYGELNLIKAICQRR